MNKQELYDYADKLRGEDRGINVILGSIDSVITRRKSSEVRIQLLASLICDYGVANRFYQLDSDHGLTAVAIEYEKEGARLAELFVTLACVLQALGHKIDY